MCISISIEKRLKSIGVVFKDIRTHYPADYITRILLSQSIIVIHLYPQQFKLTLVVF